MKYIFSIEGNIGSGKSTIIERLKERFNDFIYLPEPIEEWNKVKDTHGETILEKFYKSKERYSFSFQMLAYISRLSQLKRAIESAPENAVIITERCLHTDRHIFAQMLYDTGYIEEIEFKIYLQWFDEFNTFYYAGIIYIQVNPEVCALRIKTRNRKGEESIPLEYLVSCHNYHEIWIGCIENIKVFTFNGNNEIDIEEIYDTILDTIFV